MMRSVWICVLGFCLLMCSCKSKESARLINEVSKEKFGTIYEKYQALVDTSRTLRIDVDKSKLTITEHIIITKYDKDTGSITEKTETEREITQDSDKVVSEEENKGQSEVKNDSLNHFADFNKMVDEEVKEESKGGQESFGKWLGIVLGCFFVGLFVYLRRKIRVN